MLRVLLTDPLGAVRKHPIPQQPGLLCVADAIVLVRFGLKPQRD